MAKAKTAATRGKTKKTTAKAVVAPRGGKSDNIVDPDEKALFLKDVAEYEKMRYDGQR